MGEAAFAGLIIGASAALFVLGNGRIAGLSGILGSVLGAFAGGRLQSDERTRHAFFLGILASPWVWQLARPLPAVAIESNPLLLGAAGILVGFGTRMGNGCTSGHGVCGVARLSPRSIVATAVFVTAGMVTTFVVRHVIGQ
jgi:uncharacterized membrane protein YedE/YeeE